jgi:periplasmic divalent cation tolerance protein
VILIYITCTNEQEAIKISKHLLEKKIIVCANYFPSKSMYFDEEKIKSENEYVIILKTYEEKFSEVESEVKKIHSYEIPCIIKILAVPNSEYGNWLNRQLS